MLAGCALEAEADLRGRDAFHDHPANGQCQLALLLWKEGNRRLKPTCFSKPTWATISACHKDAETERSQVPTK